MPTGELRRYGKYTVELTNTERVLDPASGLTKLGLANYYEQVADRMLPFLRDRALTLHRFPEGFEAAGFFQQSAGAGIPDWVSRVAIERRGGGTTERVVAGNTATLVALANLGTVAIHAWASRVDRPEQPDRLIIDLDPGEGGFAEVQFAALETRALLEGELGLSCFPMTTGSRGVHVVAPLRRGPGFEEVRDLAVRCATVLAERHPERLTIEQRKNKREGRLYLDTGRNAYGQTAVAPYAVRARPGAPVAMPVTWEELAGGSVDAQTFRAPEFDEWSDRDPWPAPGRRARGLGGALEALARLERRS